MKYIFAIDESGTTSGHIKRLNRFKANGELNKDEKYQNLTIVKVDWPSYNLIVHQYLQLKLKYFKDKSINIHAAELFYYFPKYHKWSHETVSNFLNEFYTFLVSAKYVLYIVEANVESHYKKYNDPYDPYQYGLNLLLERINKDITDFDTINLYIEKRGDNEDIQTQKLVYEYFLYEFLNAVNIEVWKNISLNLNL